MNLTQREIEIIASVAEGNTHSEIGRLLGIARETVNTHLDNIREKLDATNTVNAVAIALKKKLIS